MKKQIQKLKSWGIKLLETELIAILAVSFVLMGMFWVQAASDSTDLSFTILDSGTLTVTAPDGGEDWQIDTTQNVTWSSTGNIANIKIELQRSSGGSWGTLIESTPNDGGYPWPVTSPTTEEALIKITSTTVPGITDTSNAVFTISEAPEPPASGGGDLLNYPMINSVEPLTFHYLDEVVLDINGIYFDPAGWIEIGQIKFTPEYIDSKNLLVSLSSKTFLPGDYYVCAYSSEDLWGCYHLPLVVTGDGIVYPPVDPPIVPPSTGGEESDIYKALWVKQSLDPEIKIRDEAILWVEYKNIGTAMWQIDGDSPVYLGTANKFDRGSLFYHSSWSFYNRPTLVNKIVPPGAIGRFEFDIRAPWFPGDYTESFSLVAEDKTWIDVDKFAIWDIKVKPKTITEIIEKPEDLFKPPLLPPLFKPELPSVITPRIPSTGGEPSIGIPQEPLPDGTLVFIDEIEQCPWVLLIWLLILISMIKTFTQKIPSIWMAWLLILLAWALFFQEGCSNLWVIWVFAIVTAVLYIKDLSTKEFKKEETKR